MAMFFECNVCTALIDGKPAGTITIYTHTTGVEYAYHLCDKCIEEHLMPHVDAIAKKCGREQNEEEVGFGIREDDRRRKQLLLPTG
jgi:hypothetical protein